MSEKKFGKSVHYFYSDYNGFGGIITHLINYYFITSKRFGNIACGFNHRSGNGNDDYALKGMRVKLRP